MIKKLIPKESVEDLFASELIVSFFERFSDHIYELNLSNTQSRRTRAGAEFENMIGLLLMGCQIPFIHQGSLSKHGLNKFVDLMVPDAEGYFVDSKRTLFISVKTTLRERWQEVLEDMKLLDKSEIFLVTLDEEISSETFSKFDYFGIRIVTTQSIKKNSYSFSPKVLSFEDLVSKCLEVFKYWENYKYSDAQKESLIQSLNIEITKNRGRSFVIRYLESKIEKLLKS